MLVKNKFIVLGHPRTGSTLVMLTLRTHPEIRMFGELFHEEFFERVLAFGSGIACRPSKQLSPARTKGWAYTDSQEGEQFLEQLVFGDRGDDAPVATGFKFFYAHARSGPRQLTTWDYLRRNREIRIVHLIRRNLLECLLSSLTAELTQVWNVPISSALPRPTQPIAISPDECEKYFLKMTRLREQAISALDLRGRKVLDIEYEDDIKCKFDHTMRRIQEFVGVEPKKLSSQLQQQSSGLLESRIQNYGELRTHFKHSSYSSFF